MKNQLKILLTGLFVVVPFAITVWVITAAAFWLDGLGKAALRPIWDALGLKTLRWSAFTASGRYC